MKLKHLASAAMLVAVSHASYAAEPQFVGQPDCRIADMQYDLKRAEVSWTGGCKDGYAEGEGKLEFALRKKTLLRYVGQMRRGMPDGAGFIALSDGTIYEGTFKEGLYHGKGAGSGWMATYEGEYRNGKFDGHGRATFSLGGSYEGEWRGGVFHGKGTAVYASGRVYTGEFIDGRRAGDPAPATSEERFKLWTDNPAKGWLGSGTDKMVSNLDVPADKRYDEMTPAQQAVVRSWYPLLDKDDEPPFPVDGTQAIWNHLWEGMANIADDGVFRMMVDVDSAGKVTNVAVVQTPNKAMARVAMTTFLNHRFKPARCAGKPCAMKYPFVVQFGGK